MADTSLKLILLGEDKSASKALGAVGIGAAVAGAALVKFGSDAVQAYIAAEKQQAKLEDAFSRFPKLADTNIGRLNELNAAIQRKVGADADDLAGAQATLAQYDLTGKQLERITPLLVDYATKTGKDMPTAAGLLGKALMGNARAMKDLGIDFKATGDRAADFDTIVGHLDEKVGGYADSVPDVEKKQKILAASFEDLQEDIGEKLLPVVISLVESGQGLVDWASDNTAVLVPLGTAATVAAGAIGSVVVVAKSVQGIKAMRENIKALGDAYTGMSTKARVASVSMGAVGIALTVGAALWAAYAGEQEKAKQTVESYTAAIESDTGAIAENVRMVAAKRLEDAGVLRDAELLGVSTQELTSAVMGQGTAYEDMMAKLSAVRSAYAENGKGSKEAFDASGRMFEALQDENSALQEAAGSYARVKSATGDATGATKDNTKATEENRDAQKELNDELMAGYRQTLALRGDTRALEAAYDDAAESIKKNGKVLNTHTAEGRANQEALDRIATTALQVKSGMEEAGAGADEVNDEMGKAREEFIKTARQMGATKKRAEELADQLGLIKSKEITVKATIRVGGDRGIKTTYTAGGGVKFAAFATGGVPRPGEWVSVGEQGVEAVRLPAGSQVYPATSKESRALAGGGGTTININVSGALDPQSVSRQVRSMLLDLKTSLGGKELGIA